MFNYYSFNKENTISSMKKQELLSFDRKLLKIKTILINHKKILLNNEFIFRVDFLI